MVRGGRCDGLLGGMFEEDGENYVRVKLAWLVRDFFPRRVTGPALSFEYRRAGITI
jgi:hypothetical protein